MFIPLKFSFILILMWFWEEEIERNLRGQSAIFQKYYKPVLPLHLLCLFDFPEAIEMISFDV